MFKGPSKETKHTLLPFSMLLLKEKIETLESKNSISDKDKLTIRMLKTEYEILKRLNLDTNIKCIGKTIEDENFEIQHSVLILDSPQTVEVYNKLTHHITDLITIRNIVNTILQTTMKEDIND